jgi:uncharacterized phage protein gp47/JayE
MAYFAPCIDSSGLHIPTYSDIRDDLITQAKQIFGQDIYLENDSQDYQLISIFALKIFDAFQTAQLVYNNRGPATAIGAGLIGIVKLNGIKPKTPSHSTCQVVLSGTTGTVIENGIVADVNGVNWDLPATVTIGSGGTVTATATCQEIGAITALAGDIAEIVTPTKGWVSVNNTAAAVAGQPVESGSQLRARQTTSTATPSRTILEGTEGAIAAVSGVARYKVYENDTNTENSLGLPPHSLTVVVEGGSDTDVAGAICRRKGIGSYTNGDQVVNLANCYGSTSAIRFYRPEYVAIQAEITIKALAGYTTATTTAIKEAVVNFLNSFELGTDLLTISGIQGAALGVMSSLTKPTFSVRGVKASAVGGTLGTSDIALGFKQVPSGAVANVTINFVT